jgi:hypothetical protein
MKIRIAIAKVGKAWCAHGFDGATDEQMAACVRSKKLVDKVPVRFVTVDIPAPTRATKSGKTRRAA